MNVMKEYHVSGMGWSDISQQLTTFPDGKVVAIENVGNFDSGNDQMTPEQRETFITVAALLCIKLGLTPSVDSIQYHHWWDMNTGERVLDNNKGYAVKTCPGTGFYGGNSTKDAQNNFYPLVREKMREILATM